MPGFMIEGKGQGPSNELGGSDVHRIHRWSFEWTGLGKEVQDYALNCTRPTLDIDTVTIHQRQNEAYLPGKHRWAPIRLTLYVMQKDTLQKLKQLRDKTVTTNEGMNNYAMERNSVSQMTLQALNGEGQVIYKWILEGCWISKIEHPTFNYDNSDLATVEVMVAYDYAKEEE